MEVYRAIFYSMYIACSFLFCATSCFPHCKKKNLVFKPLASKGNKTKNAKDKRKAQIDQLLRYVYEIGTNEQALAKIANLLQQDPSLIEENKLASLVIPGEAAIVGNLPSYILYNLLAKKRALAVDQDLSVQHIFKIYSKNDPLLVRNQQDQALNPLTIIVKKSLRALLKIILEYQGHILYETLNINSNVSQNPTIMEFIISLVEDTDILNTCWNTYNERDKQSAGQGKEPESLLKAVKDRLEALQEEQALPLYKSLTSIKQSIEKNQ